MTDPFEAAPLIDFPSPPERIPDWAWERAEEWKSLDEFDILVKAEELCSRSVQLKYVKLPHDVWGLHIARGARACLCINSELPLLWRRFALFHELYHLIVHKCGEAFWRRTFFPLTTFENDADLFAWAVIWPEWSRGDYVDWQ